MKKDNLLVFCSTVLFLLLSTVSCNYISNKYNQRSTSGSDTETIIFQVDTLTQDTIGIRPKSSSKDTIIITDTTIIITTDED